MKRVVTHAPMTIEFYDVYWSSPLRKVQFLKTWWGMSTPGPYHTIAEQETLGM